MTNTPPTPDFAPNLPNVPPLPKQKSRRRKYTERIIGFSAVGLYVIEAGWFDNSHAHALLEWLQRVGG